MAAPSEQALLNGPAMPPPDGIIPNFANPPNLNKEITFTLALCMSVATLLISIRMYTKMFIIRSVGHEDYAIVIALAASVGLVVPGVYDMANGGGIHMWDITLKTFFGLLYWINVSEILYGIIIFFIKLSILLQYLRIFVTSRNGNMALLVAIQVCIWCCLLFYLIIDIFAISACVPREKIWNPLMSGHCIDTDSEYKATGIFNVVSDFAVLILPIAPLWRLQMPLRRKFGVSAIFATGLLACAFSLTRTYFTFLIVKPPDVSYNAVVIRLWTWAEITIGIIIACLPVIPKFFQHFSSKMKGSFSPGYKSNTKLGHTLGSIGNSDTTKVSSKHKSHFTQQSGGTITSDPWCESNSAKARLKDEYITLDDYDSPPPKSDLPVAVTRKSNPTRRDDLESGMQRVS